MLRQIPIVSGEHVTGFVDLALERAYNYKLHQPSVEVDLKGDLAEMEKSARYQMLERLADHDDALMEKSLRTRAPNAKKSSRAWRANSAKGLIVPVLLGSALNDSGIRRLWKALRHEVPGVAETKKRVGYDVKATAAYVFRTIHTPHGGKLSLARVLSGTIKDGETLKAADEREARLSGLSAMQGQALEKRSEAKEGRHGSSRPPRPDQDRRHAR